MASAYDIKIAGDAGKTLSEMMSPGGYNEGDHLVRPSANAHFEKNGIYPKGALDSGEFDSLALPFHTTKHMPDGGLPGSPFFESPPSITKPLHPGNHSLTEDAVEEDAHPINPYHEILREKGYSPHVSGHDPDGSRVNEYTNNEGHTAGVKYDSSKKKVTGTYTSQAYQGGAKTQKTPKGFSSELSRLEQKGPARDANDSTAEDKRFTESLHARKEDGRFILSSGKTKNSRRKA